MADFRERLQVLVDSVFDPEGFRDLQKFAAKTRAMMQGLGTDINNAIRGDFSGGGGAPRANPFTQEPIAGKENTGRLQEMRLRMMGLASAFGITESNVASFRSGMGGAIDRVKDMDVSTRSLSMRLLGLQFQLLGVAFIFGAMIGSALGAVGAFQILGNTIKFLFLPTALDMLGPLLDIQSAVLSMDRSTRKTIGTIFLWVAALSLVGALLAFFGNVVVQLIGGLSALVTTFTSFSSLTAALSAAWQFLVGIFGSALGVIGGIISFLGGLVAGFLIVVKTAKKFGKIVALAVGVILIAIGAVVAAIASIPAVIVAAIGLAIGALIGLIVTFSEEIMAAIGFVLGLFADLIGGIIGLFMGLINFIVNDVIGGIVGIFEWLYNFLVGNSIIPDLIKDIISWFMKLPQMAFKIGKQIVNSIVDGILGIGSKIFDAFKQVLPDFVVDALEGVGSAAAGVANAAGNFAGGVMNTVGSLNPFGGGNPSPSGGQAQTVQNNTTVNANLTQTESTPQEEEDRLSGIISNANNNTTGNRSGGF